MGGNGKKLCTSKSRHIGILYLFVKDWVESNNIPIVYCITEQMLADLFTKNLQRALLVKKFKVIMVWKHVDTLQMGEPSTKECVGNVVDVEPNKR